MTIRHLDFFLAERRLIQTDPMNALQGIRLGIDGFHWVKKLLGRDPLALTACTLPWNWKQIVLNELKVFEEMEITPVYVFPGLQPIKKLTLEPTSSSGRGGDHSNPANNASDWESIQRANYVSYICDHNLNPIFELFSERGIEFIRAPYLTWPQLAYLANPKRNIFHTVFGSSDMFMLEVDRVILSFDFQNRSFNWVDKASILYDLRMNDDQFLDVCLLSGLESYCPTFPPLNESTFHFKSICDVIRQFRSGINAIQMFVEHPLMTISYADTFCRTRSMIKFHLIMNEHGIVEPLNYEYAPNDLHDVLGHRLPPILYFYLCQGMISPSLLNTLLAGTFYELIPGNLAQSTTLLALIKDLNALRSQTFHMISHDLHGFFQKRSVNVKYVTPGAAGDHRSIISEWKSLTTAIHHDFEPGLDSQFTWQIGEDFKLGKGSLENQLLARIADYVVSSSTTSAAASTELRTPDQVIALVMCEFLELRNYLTIDHLVTKKLRILSEACSSPPESESEPIESENELLLLALELIRSKLLSTKGDEEFKKGIVPPTPGSTTAPSSEEASAAASAKRSERLFLRTMCLLNATPSPGSFKSNFQTQTPSSYNATLIQSFLGTATFLNRYLRHFLEALLFNLSCKGRVLFLDLGEEENNSAALYQRVWSTLPFTKQSFDGSMAHLCSKLLSLKDKDETDNNANANQLISFLAYPARDLKRAQSFWNNLVRLIKNLNEAREIRESVYLDFCAADAWLQEQNLFKSVYLESLVNEAPLN